MTKFAPPRNIEEMTMNYYKIGNHDWLNSYNKYLNNPTKEFDGLNISERKIRDFLSRLGDVGRLPEERHQKNPDLLIRERNFVVEVTSINTAYSEGESHQMNINVKDDNMWKEKVKLTLIEKEKKFTNYKTSVKIIAIYIELLQWTLTSANLEELITTDILIDRNVDAL